MKTINTYILILISQFSLAFNSFSQIQTKYIKHHDKAILSTNFSPDSKKIACLTADKTIKIYSTETGELLSVLDDKGEGDVAICFSPDSKLLAAGSWDKTVKIWDLEKNKILRRLIGHKQATRSVSFNFDGNLIATAGWDDIIKVWYAPTGINLKNLSGHTQCIRAISFSPDGNFIASGGYDLQLKVWDLSTGNTVFSIKAADFPIETICYSPDGNYIATAGLENVIKIWDAKNGALIKVLKGHTDAVFSLSYSPDGRYIASGGNDNIIKIWTSEEGICVFNLKGHSQGIRSVEFSNNGKYLVTGAVDKVMRLWDVSYLGIKEKKNTTLPFLTETKNEALISWEQPMQNPSISFSKYVTVIARINDPDFKNIQFYLNKIEYTKYDDGNSEIVKPISMKVIYNKGLEVTYDVYLDNPENEIQLFAESSDKKLYAFSKPLFIHYYDISNQAKNCHLFMSFVNPKSYNDKKLNGSYEKDNSEKLIGILKTQEGKLFSNVTNNDFHKLNKETILNKTDSITNLINKSDIYFYFLSGIFVKDQENKIFYISPEASLKDLNSGLINLNELTNSLIKTKGLLGLFINASHHLSKYPENYVGANEIEIYNTLSKNLASIKEKAIFVIDNPENTQFFDVIANSLHPSNDKDNNNVIDFNEVISFTTQLYKLHYQYNGRYLPLYLHGVVK